MEELILETRHTNGTCERTVTTGVRALVGSGAHCDLRLSPDQAAFEHVAIEMGPDGLRLQRLASSPPCTLDGAPFAVSTVTAAAELAIGSTLVRVERRSVEAPTEKRKPAVGAIVRACVLGVLVGAVAVLVKMPRPTAEPPFAELPEIFGASAPACPRTDVAEARAIAEDRLAIADGARERSPFAAREAIAAAKAYDVAAACYRAAGDVEAAEEAAGIAREIEFDTRLELRARRLRLERMLAVGDVEIARQDVAVLRVMTEGHDGEYVSWLALVEQELKAERKEL